jgi:hypothetical protein
MSDHNWRCDYVRYPDDPDKECHCAPSDVNPVCGCHLSARCPTCTCCKTCVGCHCAEARVENGPDQPDDRTT